MGHTNYSGTYQEPSWESIGGLVQDRMRYDLLPTEILLDGHNHLGVMRGDRKVGSGWKWGNSS